MSLWHTSAFCFVCFGTSCPKWEKAARGVVLHRPPFRSPFTPQPSERRNYKWSEWRDSNPRHPAPKNMSVLSNRAFVPCLTLSYAPPVSSLKLFCPACFKEFFRLLGFVWDWILCIKRCSAQFEEGNNRTNHLRAEAQEMRRIKQRNTLGCGLL